jgi:Heterokaryon incompatibility protein (HET)
MSDQTYSYKRLQGHRYIRLLKLRPGSWNDDICCELEVTSLDEQPEYEALSYAWDDKPNSRRISLDNQPFSICTTLESAFRRLRHSECLRILWVDSLCINQEDVEERSAQVSLMRDIYTDSQRVLIWLGEHESKGGSTSLTPSCEPEWGEIREDHLRILSFTQRVDSYHALPIAIRHFPEQDLDLAAFCFITQLSYGHHVHDMPLFKNVKYWRNVLGALGQIMRKDWWTRIWVVQEAVLAPQATIIYGRFKCPWEIFASAARCFRQHRLTCCSEYPDGFQRPDTEIPRNFSRVVLGIEGARHMWRDKQPITLLPLLWRFRSRKSLDPRDKVYSLLSLVKSWGSRPPIHPDYSLTPEQLYRTVVRELIKVTGNLSVLMGTLTKSPGLRSLPSWVPDWTVEPPSFEQDRLERAVLYKASADRPPLVRFISDEFLECRGLIVTEISAVGDKMPSDLGDLALKTFRQWETLADIYQNPPKTYVAGGTAMQAYWRTLCLDTLYKAEAGNSGICRKILVRAPANYGSSLEFWIRESRSTRLVQESNASGSYKPMTGATANIPPPELMAYWVLLQNGPLARPPSLVAAINYAVRSATTHRRFFRTAQGCYMGLGPSTLKAGDKICVLLGGLTPFIIRSTSNQEVGRFDRQPCYELIGDCYVDGLMDGQVFGIQGLKEERIYLGPCASNSSTERAKL